MKIHAQKTVLALAVLVPWMVCANEEVDVFALPEKAPTKEAVSADAPAVEKPVTESAKPAPAKPAAATTEKNAKPEKPALPTFQEGPEKGFHAVFRKPKFEAKIKSTGSLVLQCLDKGKPVGKPITVGPTYGYTDSNKRWHGRTVKQFTVYSQQPTLSPKKIQIEGELTDGVTFGLVYEFLNNQVSVSGWVVDPPSIQYPTSYNITSYFYAVKEFEPTVPVADRKKEMAPYSVSVTPVSGSTKKYPYGDVAKGMSSSAVKKVLLQGPLYGPMTKVSLSAFSPSKAPLQVWIYQDFAPYQGYSVSLRKQDKASRDPNQKMILKVE